MSKYHVNSGGNVAPCTASKRPCKYGSEDHFDDRKEASKAAEKRLEEQYKSIKQGIKKNSKSLPKTIDVNGDLSALSSNDRADAMVFKAMLDNDSIEFGLPSDNDYYGSGRAVLDDDTAEKLVVIGVLKNKKRVYGKSHKDSVKSAISRGYKINFVPSSLRDKTTYHFNGTFATSNSEKVHVSADAVITSPDGVSVAVPITTHAYFSDLLSRAIRNGKEADAKKLTANYLDRGLVDHETAFRSWLDS